jgi:hypothetical protein
MALQRAHRLAWWVTLVGVALSVAGIGVLLAYALSEVLADPTISLEDAYWIGRLPWTSIGVSLTVIGATVALAFGALTSWIAGGLVRRVVTGLAVAVGAFWWLIVTLPLIGTGGAYCPSCPPPGPEPLTMAYSTPQYAVMWLLLPAAVASALSLTSSVRMRSSWA